MKSKNYRGIAGLGPVEHQRYAQRMARRQAERRERELADRRIQAELDRLRQNDLDDVLGRRLNVVATAAAILAAIGMLAIIVWLAAAMMGGAK